MADCGCIYIQWTPTNINLTFGSGEYNPVGVYNGSSYYEFIADGVTYFLYFRQDGGTDFWIISTSLGGTSVAFLPLSVGEECPTNLNWINESLEYTMMMTECNNPFLDCCFNQTMTFSTLPDEVINGQTFQTASGFNNGKPYWSWCSNTLLPIAFDLFADLDKFGECIWRLKKRKCVEPFEPTPVDIIFQLLGICGCPLGTFDVNLFDEAVSGFLTEPCVRVCIPIEDRDLRVYQSIKLPMVFTEQNRGFKICCDPLVVLAGGETETWKNDVSSAWIKVSDPSDLFDFILEKDGVPVTSYTLTVEEFPNEENAYYTTIQWRDVLALEGAGCYELKITYNISGLEGAFSWASYNLMPYSIQNALKTARIRVKFNLKQEIEGINFTGANVEDSFRFWGFIGDRQVNTEIDNLIYQDRSVKTVVRENLDTYVISTDPLQECFITPLTDLYLLSENEMWISDYNAHNHSYRILDVPVVVQEAAEIDYLDRWQRRAVLTCTVGLRNKKRRTHY